MAKTDNLTDFLTGVANAIRTKKGTTAKINPQNFETEIGSITTSKPEQEKTITITTNGSRTVTPDGGKVLSKVTITTNVPAIPTEEKMVELALANGNQVISSDSGKVLSKVTIIKPTSLVPENIKKGVDIGDVIGTLEVTSKPEQEKTAELALANGNQVISPDSGKVLSKVTIIKPVALIPENIRKNTEIGGVIGALEEAKPEQEKTAEATNSRQIISPNVGKTLSKVVIEAAPLPSSGNGIYKNTNKCLINIVSKTLILGCNDSIIPSDIGITSIGDYAFSYCRGLTSITIPDSVTSIKGYAFYDCSGLTSITIPDSVTSMGYSAFEECSGLTSVTIGSGVTSIGLNVFNRCSRIESLIVAEGNEKYHSINNCIIETETKKLIAGCKTSIIPSDGSVTTIGNHAFNGCSGLTSIIIPNSVILIGDYAFFTCEGLIDLTIGDGVTSIGVSAFYYCIGLTDVIIPNSVTSIGNGAFESCNGLTNVTMLPTTPPQLGNNVFPSNVTAITVPAGCGETYKAAEGWSAYTDKIVEAAA